ncbi:hypothetical protein JSY36_19165 [Bacillus sp. H-16]|nr:hypothetical protein [Alteribacter salitolerans]MBM7097861.1 hypothetical protein [Alteribacter salitolerans]
MKVYNELHNEMSSAGVKRDLQAWHLEAYPDWLGATGDRLKVVCMTQ